MIFDADYSSTNLSAVKESPYELGLAGAMMHVYENECNYNAIMKSVGLSELKYYQETGKDLFVNEAGAFGSFIDKIKAFFKKVIEKIKSIFKKFVAIFNQYTMDGKKFAKKYGNELMRKNLTGFEFEGYNFGNFDSVQTMITNTADTLTKNLSEHLERNYNISKLDFSATGGSTNQYKKYDVLTSDTINDKKEENRAEMLKKSSGSLDESEFKDELKDLLYGNDGSKETLDSISIREQLNYISECDKDIRKVEKTQKDTEKSINKLLKELDKVPQNLNKEFKYGSEKEKEANEDGNKAINNFIKMINNEYELAKSKSNDITIAFGMLVGAYRDRNKQARAICIKALSYKHESAMVSESYSDDIFAGVVIR